MKRKKKEKKKSCHSGVVVVTQCAVSNSRSRSVLSFHQLRQKAVLNQDISN